MNKLFIIGLLATASAVSAQTPASASTSVVFYAEPSVVIAFPGDFYRAVGGALALGATINHVHSIEADTILFKAHEKGYSDDFKFMPVLATYKYSFVLDHKLSLTAGASVGATFEKTEYYADPMPGGLGGTGHYTISDTAFTSGVLGGISYAFSNRVTFTANAHVLRLEKTDLTTAGNMVLVTLGVKFRF